MDTPRPFLVAPLGAVLLAVALAGGCAPVPQGSGAREQMTWPYPGIGYLDRVPEELVDIPLFTGRWVMSDPDGLTAFVEVADPRYLGIIPFGNRRRLEFLDVGVGAEVENLAFLDGGRSLLAVAAVVSPHHTRAVMARALLEVDLENRTLIAATTLDRDDLCRGMVVDPYRRRAHLLNDRGGGRGTVETLDLYRGAVVSRAPVGAVPALVGRKGLVADRNVRSLYCLAGGDDDLRSDFAPVDTAASAGPELVVLETDSLRVLARIPLDAAYDPVAVVYDGGLDRVFVLETGRRRSVVVVVDPNFHTIRARVELPEETTDLTLSGGYAFAAGANGVYIVDLAGESWISRAAIPLEYTAEIAVSGDQSTAFILFESTEAVGGPGVAVVDLSTGTLMDILQ